MHQQSPLNYSGQDSSSSSDKNYQEAYERLKRMQQQNHLAPSEDQDQDESDQDFARPLPSQAKVLPQLPPPRKQELPPSRKQELPPAANSRRPQPTPVRKPQLPQPKAAPKCLDSESEQSDFSEDENKPALVNNLLPKSYKLQRLEEQENEQDCESQEQDLQLKSILKSKRTKTAKPILKQNEKSANKPRRTSSINRSSLVKSAYLTNKSLNQKQTQQLLKPKPLKQDHGLASAASRRRVAAKTATQFKQTGPGKGKVKKSDPVSRYQQLNKQWSTSNFIRCNGETKEGRKLQMAERIASSRPDVLYSRYMKRSELF